MGDSSAFHYANENEKEGFGNLVVRVCLLLGYQYKNIVGDMLSKSGYDLFFYKDQKGQLVMDFFVRDKDSLVPLEVKATDNSTVSLNNLINKDKYSDVKYGIKLAHKNIGFNGKFYTIPYFLTFMLKRFLREKE